MRLIVRFCSISVIAGFLFFGCKKSKSESNIIIPSAQSIHDSKSGGIYKGTIVGSSGNFAVVLQDGINKIYINLDGSNYTLTTQTAITSGMSINNAVFTDGSITMNFSVNADGSNAAVTQLMIPGHPGALAIVLKETSTNVVKVYEGRFTKTSGLPTDHCTGTINFVVNGSSYLANYREDQINNGSAAGSFSGGYSGNQINTNIGSASVSVTLTDQTITGRITGACSSAVNCMRTM